jgi:hypothetical protein
MRCAVSEYQARHEDDITHKEKIIERFEQEVDKELEDTYIYLSNIAKDYEGLDLTDLLEELIRGKEIWAE